MFAQPPQGFGQPPRGPPRRGPPKSGLMKFFQETYEDQFKWSVVKSVTAFALGVFFVRQISEEIAHG